MFLHLSVILFTGGLPAPLSPGRPPWADTPLRSACWDTVNKRAGRILLECILVISIINYYFPRRFPEGGEELRHAIENAFDNLNAVGIADVDLINPHGDFSFSLWGVTSRFDFDRSWLQNEHGNHGNQMDWVQPPRFPGLNFLPFLQNPRTPCRNIKTFSQNATLLKVSEMVYSGGQWEILFINHISDKQTNKC